MYDLAWLEDRTKGLTRRAATTSWQWRQPCTHCRCPFAALVDHRNRIGVALTLRRRDVSYELKRVRSATEQAACTRPYKRLILLSNSQTMFATRLNKNYTVGDRSVIDGAASRELELSGPGGAPLLGSALPFVRIKLPRNTPLSNGTVKASDQAVDLPCIPRPDEALVCDS